MFILEFIFAVIITEALTELLTKSGVFLPLKKWFFNRRTSSSFKFFHDLLDCGYCTSVWVGFFVSLAIIDLHFVHAYLEWFVAWIATHRCSNILHFIIDWIRDDPT